MLDVALDLIDKGYHVFQVKPNDKGPLFATAPNGCNSATSDPAIVRKWFAEYPDANIGIKCDNVLVLDLDVKPEQQKRRIKIFYNYFHQITPETSAWLASQGLTADDLTD